jgi:hypothetical protein
MIRSVVLIASAVLAGCQPAPKPGTVEEVCLDSQYFSRCATWSRLDDQIVVHDSVSPQAPRMITMDPWPQMVFMAADGVHTVDEFVEHMGNQYEGGPPDGLREQIHAILDELVGEGIVKLHDEPEALPPFIAEEYFEKTPEVRKQEMIEHGVIEDAPGA